MRAWMGAMALAAGLCAHAAHAGPGNIYMSWSGCNVPPVRDLTVSAGQATGVDLFVFVKGQSDATRSYDCSIWYGDTDHLVPDAWRFDAAGCQGPAFLSLLHLAPAAVAPTCPSFQDAGGAHESFVATKIELSPPSFPYPRTLMHIELGNVYPAGNVPDPGTTYFLMGVQFDLLYAVVGPSDPAAFTCGGVERALCFSLRNPSYMTADGSTTVPFVTEDMSGPSPARLDFVDWVTVNSGGGSLCDPTPAHAATWGSIKAQYRE